MFGLLRGCGNLSKAQHAVWWSHVCGACVTLGKEYGQLTRFATSFDASVLSLLVAAQSSSTLTTIPHTCAFRGFKTKDIVKHDTKAARYAALLNMAIVTTKLKDKAIDGDNLISKIAPSALVATANSFSGSLHQHAHDLGFSEGLTSIIKLAETQISVEQNAKAWSNPNFPEIDKLSYERFLELSKCTEESIGIAFSHTCTLASSPQNHKILHEIGKLFGRIMYLLDSFEDYRWDVRAKRFNSLFTSFPHFHESPSQRANVVKKIFDSSFLELRTHVYSLKLPHTESASVLRSLLVDQLHSRGRRIFATVSPSTVFSPLYTSAGNCACNSNKQKASLQPDFLSCAPQPLLLASDGEPTASSPSPSASSSSHPSSSPTPSSSPSSSSPTPSSAKNTDSKPNTDTNNSQNANSKTNSAKNKKYKKPLVHITLRKPKILRKGENDKEVSLNIGSKRALAQTGIIAASVAALRNLFGGQGITEVKKEEKAGMEGETKEADDTAADAKGSKEVQEDKEATEIKESKEAQEEVGKDKKEPVNNCCCDNCCTGCDCGGGCTPKTSSAGELSPADAVCCGTESGSLCDCGSCCECGSCDCGCCNCSCDCSC